MNIYLPGLFELAVFVGMLYASFQLAQPEPSMWLMGSFVLGFAFIAGMRLSDSVDLDFEEFDEDDLA